MTSQKFNIILENILLATSYLIFAKFCQLVAIEPGNISPIWLSSGICFAWVYWRGYKLLPGDFIGAFIGNVSAYIFSFKMETFLIH